MPARAALLCAAALLLRAAAADCHADKTQPLHDEAKLHEDVLCNYHPEFRPVKDHKSAILVKIRLVLKYISFDALEETFTVHSWVALAWKDEFLSWTPSNYGGITEIQMESQEIWTPRMALFNADATSYPSDSFYTTCMLTYEGIVTCVPHLAHSGICRTALRRWPYDIQSCSFFFGSWMHTGEQVNYSFYDVHPVDRDDFQNGPGWYLTNVVNERKKNPHGNTTYPMLNYTFMLKREAAGPAAVVVVPSIAIVTLTLISLLLDVKDNIRLMLACFSLFGHFTFLIEIGQDIPKHSSDTPIILLFLRDSMLMTLLAILVTLMLMSMRRRTLPAPTWVVSVTRLVASGPGKYVVFTEFDPADGAGGDTARLTDGGGGAPAHASEDESRQATEWIQFANLLNSCMFIVSVLIYFVLICVYIPYDN